MKAGTAQVSKLKKPRWILILASQIFVLLLLLSLAWALAIETLVLLSMAIGAGIFIVPNAYFSHYAFRYTGARAAQQVTQSFYKGEAGKFILTAVLFAVSFAVVKPINELAVFLVYVFFMVLTWMLAWQITK